MAMKFEDYGNVCVVAPDHDFAGDATKELRRCAEERIEQRRISDFVIDFEKVDLLDSEGLETLLLLKGRCEDRFGQIKLVKLNESCRKILEITRLEHRFECHGELAAALKTMR